MSHTPTENLNLGKVVKDQLSFSTLKGLTLGELNGFVVEFRKTDETLKVELKDLREKRAEPISTMGKVLSAYQARFDLDQKDGEISAGVTFNSYFEEKAGSKYEKLGRSLQCARVFNRLVIPGILPESDYDVIAEDWLAVTSVIIDELLKAGKGVNPPGDDLLDVVNVLKLRPKKGAQALRQIKNLLQGKDTVSDSGKGPELDAENAVALLDRIMASELPGKGGMKVNGLLLVAGQLGGAIPNAGTLPRSVAKSLWMAMAGMRADFPATLAREFSAEYVRENSDVTVVSSDAKAVRETLAIEAANPVSEAEIPAGESERRERWEWLTGAYALDGTVPEDDAKAMRDGLDFFVTSKNRMPANSDELDAFMVETVTA